jgi:hypothetical protein
MVEAGVTSAGSLRRIGVDALEILDDRFHRGMQTVKVEAVKAGFSGALRKAIVVRSQPLDKFHHIGIAPHPPRKAPKIAERLRGIHIVAGIAHKPVDAIGVRPVRLERDSREALFLDEPLGDLPALAVELVRSMGSLTEQHKARVAD